MKLANGFTATIDESKRDVTVKRYGNGLSDAWVLVRNEDIFHDGYGYEAGINAGHDLVIVATDTTEIIVFPARPTDYRNMLDVDYANDHEVLRFECADSFAYMAEIANDGVAVGALALVAKMAENLANNVQSCAN